MKPPTFVNSVLQVEPDPETIKSVAQDLSLPDSTKTIAELLHDQEEKVPETTRNR